MVLMASSSPCSSNISINSGPVDGDVLWMQDKHISHHIQNGEEDRKLHFKRGVLTYQSQEEILEEIIPLLRRSERWRPETHTFHMRRGECTITPQDVNLRVDVSPLIGPTNLSWADLCEELLGVRPEEGELQGTMIKLSWLAHHFPDLNNHCGNLEQVEKFTRAWILRFIGGILFVDKSNNKVSVRYLQFLHDFRESSTYSWGSAVLGYLYREMCNTTNYKTKSIGGGCDGEINVLFVLEPYSANVMSALPPICLVGSVAWCAVVPLICFQVIEWHPIEF
ncbi:Serine/threonine-protein phosphatase 7 long form [Glycine soja]